MTLAVAISVTLPWSGHERDSARNWYGRAMQALAGQAHAAEGASSEADSLTAGATVDTPYDLGRLPDFLADLRWPEAPRTKRRIEVSNGRIQSAVSKNRARVIIAPGEYVGVNVRCSDCEIQADGVTLNGNLDFGGRQRIKRVVWKGGTINGRIRNDGADDLLIQNVHVINKTSNNLNNFTGGPEGFRRVAVVGSTFEQQNGLDGGDWVIYTMPVESYHEDLILANVRFESDGQLVRLQHIDNLVVVDSYFNSNNTGANGLRIHKETRDVYFHNTIIVGQGIGQSGPGIINGLFENVQRYFRVNNHWSQPMNIVENVTINNSDCYTSSGNGLGKPCPLGRATGSNNTFLYWDGKTLPSGEGYGADH